MRRVLIAVALIVLAGPTPGRTAAPATRTLRVEQWLKAILHHDPGVLDEAATDIGRWSNADLETLWIDATALVALMRDPKLTRFVVRADPKAEARTVRYSPDDLRRLRVLACAASGSAAAAPPRSASADPVCVTETLGLDAELRLLAENAHAAAQHGDENYVVRRGALLHADIAMARSAIGAPASD